MPNLTLFGYPAAFMRSYESWLNRQLVIGLFCLVVTLLVFEITNLDIVVQRLFYQASQHAWLLSSGDKLMRLIFYDGIKAVLILFSLVLFTLIVLSKLPGRWIKLDAGPMIVVLLSMIAVPSLVAELKQTTNMACPRNTVQFGGSVHHIPLFAAYSDFNRPDNQQKCFPAAHASAGFSLMSLMFLFGTRRKRAFAFAFGCIAGWAMGLYKMAIGDHFLSHTVVSMEIAWIVIVAIARCLPAPGQLTPLRGTRDPGSVHDSENTSCQSRGGR